MEDRIVGPLTAIQFGIVIIGGGVSFLIFTSGLPSPINSVFGLMFAFITLILAVGKFNDQPMYRFFRFFISFIFTPKVRIWHKNGTDTALIRPSPPKADNKRMHLAKKVSKQDIARLAVVLDSRGTAGIAPQISSTPKPNPKQEKSEPPAS